MWSFLFDVWLDCEQSLFSSKIRGKERKTSKRASVTVSVTWERQCREPLVTPTLLTARGVATPTSRSQSRSHAYLFCVLSHGFSRNRETARSLPFGNHVKKFGSNFNQGFSFLSNSNLKCLFVSDTAY